MLQKPATSQTPSAPRAPAAKATISREGFDSLPDGAFIRQAQLIPNVVPFSSATLWRKCKAGQFPPAQKLSQRVTAWKVGSVRSFLAGQSSW